MSIGQDEATLLSDQVFQLNVFLWAVEALPRDGPIRPVLREKGYRLLAIERKVLVPVSHAVGNALQQLLGSPDTSACRPDLWLNNLEHPVHLIVELKGRSFSPKSTTRRQAIKLIISTLDLAPSLGEGVPRRGHLVYGTASTQVDGMAMTLKQLADAVMRQSVSPAPVAVIGLSLEEDGVTLSSPTPSDLPDPAAEAIDPPAIVLRRTSDNDLRPLYLIPWIPGIEESQDSKLNKEGLHELTARVLSHTQGYIGRATISSNVVLDGDALLRDATFGIFDKWKDDNRHQFSSAVITIVADALSPYQKTLRKKKRLSVKLDSEADRQEVIQLLKRADHLDPGSILPYGQMQLFDN